MLGLVSAAIGWPGRLRLGALTRSDTRADALLRSVDHGLDHDEVRDLGRFVLALNAEPVSSPLSAWAAPGRLYRLVLARWGEADPDRPSRYDATLGLSASRSSLLVSGALVAGDRPSPAADAVGRG
jgi:hypothetical protein